MNSINESEYKLINVHSTDAVIVDLYVEYTEVTKNATGRDSTAPTVTTNTIYYLHNVSIPNGAALVLEKGDFTYPLKYENKQITPYIRLSASDSAVDVITTNY